MKITKALADYISKVDSQLSYIGCHNPVEGVAEQRLCKYAGEREIPFEEVAAAISMNRHGFKWSSQGGRTEPMYLLGVLHAFYSI